jgi:hypothetical protein
MDSRSMKAALDKAEKIEYKTLSPDEALRLAERDRAKGLRADMYDYEYRSLAAPVAATSVRATIQRARSRFVELAAAQPDSTDEALRAQLLAADSSFRAMGDAEAGTHIRLFEKVTSKSLPEDHLAVIMHMIDMRQAHERGVSVDAATRQVAEFFKTHVAAVDKMRTPEEKAAESDAEIARAEKTMDRRPPLT